MKRIWFTPAWCFFVGSFLICAMGAQPGPGEILWQLDFENALPNQVRTNEHVRIVPGWNSSRALQVATTNNGAGSVSTPVPVEYLRGARIRFEAMTKADGVTQPPKAWNGVKAMLHVTGADGQSWPQQNNVFGTF